MSCNYDFSLAEIVQDGFEIGKVVAGGIIESICNWIFVSQCIGQSSFLDYVGSSH